jgi:hypothetical protein
MPKVFLRNHFQISVLTLCSSIACALRRRRVSLPVLPQHLPVYYAQGLYDAAVSRAQDSPAPEQPLRRRASIMAVAL